MLSCEMAGQQGASGSRSDTAASEVIAGVYQVPTAILDELERTEQVDGCE